MAAGRFSTRALTAEARKIANQISAEHFDDDGTPLTHEQALAKLLWKQALGYTEEARDDEGNLTKVVHKPVAWAQQYLWERLEGKVPVAAPDHETGIKAADRVRDLAKQRVNALALAAAGGPPRHKPKKQ